MIPREILKKIRQIELRTNRIVTESAERGCPSRSTSILASALESLQGHPPIEAAAGGTPALRSGARASARFTVHPPAASKTNPALNAIRPLKRRERRAPAAPERGCVQSTSRSTPDISNAPTNHPALRLSLRPQPLPAPVCRNSKPLEFDGFGNRGEFAIIKRRAAVLIPSNSTGLEFKPADECHD